MTAKAIVRLIRLPNLMLMAFTMYSFRVFVVIPILKFSGSDTALSGLPFFLVVVSVILIAAGGYIINDYYDIEIDRINKPGKVIIGNEISEEKAYLWFHILSFSGILIAFYLSFVVGLKYIGMIHLLCALLLWGYAAYLKKKLLAGNFIISLLCSFTLFIAVFYDINAWKAEPILILLAGYSAFAFLLSFIREMIKDLEDLKGDMACGCKTLAVIAGPRITKFIISGFIIITMALLMYVQKLQYESNDIKSLAYIGLLVQIPMAYLLWRVNKSNDVAGFHFCSLISKLIMLSGILSMPVFYLSFVQ